MSREFIADVVPAGFHHIFFRRLFMKRMAMVFLAALFASVLVLPVNIFAGGGAQPAQSGPARVSILLYGENSPSAGNIVLKALEEATGTSIDMIYVPSGDHSTKLSTMVAGGTPPDIFAADLTTAQEFKDAGLLAELGKLLPSAAPNVLKDVSMDVLKMCPLNKDGIYMILSGHRGWTDNLNLRTDWLKNLGMEMPTDLDSLYKVYHAFTYNDPDGDGKQDTYGLAANANARSFSSIFGAYGIPHGRTVILADGTLTTWVKHPKFLDAVTYIRKLITEGLVEPDWATIPSMDLFGKLWNGVAGAMDFECVGPTNNWMPGRYTENPPPTFGFPIIKGPDGFHGVPPVFPNFKGDAWPPNYVVSSKADVNAALRIADFCKTPEGADLLYLGVENVMYRWTDKANGTFEYLGEYADTTTHRAAGGYCYWHLFTPADNAQLRTLNAQTRAGVAQAYAEGLSNAANVIAVLQSSVEYGAEMDQIIKELYVNILNTREDLRTVYNRYIAEWEAAGGTQWEQEVNAAWKAQGSKNF
jgi:putative aldouronate transport system substrate-binding protein